MHKSKSIPLIKLLRPQILETKVPLKKFNICFNRENKTVHIHKCLPYVYLLQRHPQFHSALPGLEVCKWTENKAALKAHMHTHKNHTQVMKHAGADPPAELTVYSSPRSTPLQHHNGADFHCCVGSDCADDVPSVPFFSTHPSLSICTIHPNSKVSFQTIYFSIFYCQS